MIYIVTACSRPENLETISKTIPPQCIWVIVHDHNTFVPQEHNAIYFQCEDTGIVGTKAQNHALDHLPLNDDDYVLLHDDDNVIHPNWYDTISKYINEDFSIMTWGQLKKNGEIRLHPTKQPRIDHIDTACFMISWRYNKNHRHKYQYNHDGAYSEVCSKNGPVVCIDDYICYYNYLR
jgi:hypothetical protein